MMRFADVIQVPADRYDEYVEKHEHIWPQEKHEWWAPMKLIFHL